MIFLRHVLWSVSIWWEGGLVVLMSGARVVRVHHPRHGVRPHEARHRGGPGLVHLLLLQQKLKHSNIHNANVDASVCVDYRHSEGGDGEAEHGAADDVPCVVFVVRDAGERREHREQRAASLHQRPHQPEVPSNLQYS